jgi:hypothetical protein
VFAVPADLTIASLLEGAVLPPNVAKLFPIVILTPSHVEF